ncbi:hypothetical protein EHI_012300 [Entamoeba histolytica HM-1:IMSS]|uniref:Uncharacterized protein n=1 Tax=Entamoeba histolytica (strain ATCC 30459 / HM-1:IMSS / ABRM) TaxID=294381 RepID=C4LTM3_ENTH1|nr:hypothetical protein EHI_012300 [Entamoeba histolytica HM-1:IMSS]EAL50793.2 hypothetical protein EHI_012300 [Entamoeba histolytica HM-1:IMSS]|eukprot:XP_656177.2 hypothetical protein EHI_012300 [Entamoeba histolytica HM-1:IMSS]
MNNNLPNSYEINKEIEMKEEVLSPNILIENNSDNNEVSYSQITTKQHNWYKRLTVTIVCVILLFSYIFTYVLLKTTPDTKEIKKILIIGVSEVLLLVIIFSIQTILLFPFVQQRLHESSIITKIMGKVYSKYNSTTFVFKLPKINKMIEKIYPPVPNEKVNKTILNRMIEKYRKFIDQHLVSIKVFSLIFCCISSIITLILIYLLIQQKNTFRILYIQTFVISVLILSVLIIGCIIITKILEITLVLLNALMYVLYKRIIFSASLFISMSLIGIVTSLIVSVIPNLKPNSSSFYLVSYSTITFLAFLLFLLSALIHTIFLCCKNPKEWMNVLKKCITSLFKHHYIATLIFFLIMLTSGITTILSWRGSILYFKSIVVPDSFNSVENNSSIKITNIPIITRDIEVITFGCGKKNYYRECYANPTIKTPTIDMSRFIELSITSQDYYHLNSRIIPLNGQVYFPKDILRLNKTSHFKSVIILPHQLGNLINSDDGYDYLQKTFAQNDLIGIVIDSSFFDKDFNDKTIISKNYNLTTQEAYIEARSILTYNILQYLNVALNNYFNFTVDMSEIGIVGDREGGAVGIRLIEVMNRNKTFPILLKDWNIITIKVISFSGLSCNQIIKHNIMNDIQSYFIETIPSISTYPNPFLSSYAIFESPDLIFINQTNILNSNRPFYYTGSLFIQRGNPNDFNIIYEEPNNHIILDNIFPIQSNYISKTQLDYIVSLFIGSHFMCSLNSNCINYKMLQDFKIADEVLPMNSGYFNTFISNNDILIDSNGKISPNITISTNSSYVGLYYQNAYQRFHRNLQCHKKCSIKYLFNVPIYAKGIEFNFYQVGNSSNYNNAILIHSNKNVKEIAKFKYAGIPQSKTPFTLSKVYFLQLFEFVFNTQQQPIEIDELEILFDGEILLDNVAVFN